MLMQFMKRFQKATTLECNIISITSHNKAISHVRRAALQAAEGEVRGQIRHDLFPKTDINKQWIGGINKINKTSTYNPFHFLNMVRAMKILPTARQLKNSSNSPDKPGRFTIFLGNNQVTDTPEPQHTLIGN
jgi:hypothetical protein